ncbi:MAG: PEP-CTERM system histidine kinase PrsK [Rhodocyclaceae bacterium]|jgi:putative PEP-CTERM system histidine kinase|nr:PEP-CTERM system histidine kinase PrsK [Rhodocyclaceae bacterium]
MTQNPELSTLPLWSYGFAAFSYLLITVHLMRWRKRGGPDGAVAWIIVAAAMTSIWATGAFLAILTDTDLADALSRTSDIVRYGAWYAFTLVLLYPAAGATRPKWPTVLGGFIVGGGLTLQLLSILPLDLPIAVLARTGQYAALAQVIFALTLLEQLLRRTTADSLWNIKPLGIGLGATFAFDLYFHSNALLFNQIDANAFAVRGFAHALVLPLLLLTIYRTRARKLQVALSQTAAFQTTSLAVAGLYLLLASAAGYYVRYLGGSWGGAMQLALLFSAFVLLLMLAFSGTMRSRLKVLVGKHFFRYRYDYREEWLKFTQALSSEEDSRQVGQQVIRGLANMVESPAGTLWMRDADGRQYSQRARWNLPVAEVGEPADSALISFLRDRGWVLNLEEYRYLPGRYEGLTLPDWLTDTPNAWLVVPLVTANEIIGFVVLTTSRAAIDVNWEVNDLLRTAGRQAAAFLAQMQAAEALLEARKFDAFNRMSAFVVHDLKNIVSQLSLMVRNAERHADNVEFQRDMLLTVQHSVERMKQLMMQLREGSAPADGSSGVGVNLDAVIRRIQKAKSAQPPGIELDIRQPVVARGHEERIERVIGHLVQNALDATPSGGRVWVRLEREGSMALIEVGDTGCGMSPEFIRDKLFRPFQTTKETGMGIGAYESRQYIRELGGDIQLESRENIGTRFHVRLPLIEIRRSSDLQQLETT